MSDDKEPHKLDAKQEPDTEPKTSEAPKNETRDSDNYESGDDSSYEPIRGPGGFVYYGTESGETSDELGNETYVSNEEYRGIGAYLLGYDHSWLSEYVDMARESDEFSNDWGRNVGAEALDKSAFIVTLTTLLNVLQF